MKKRHGEGPHVHHHEQMSSVQVTFQNQVKSQCSVIEEMGNPFLEQSKDLLALGTYDITDCNVVETVRKIEEIGKVQYQAFVTERLEKRTASLLKPIKINKSSLFSSPPPSKAKSSDKLQIASLFSALYVSCQVRDGDLETFFVMRIKAFNQPCLNLGNSELAPDQNYSLTLKKSAVYRQKGH